MSWADFLHGKPRSSSPMSFYEKIIKDHSQYLRARRTHQKGSTFTSSTLLTLPPSQSTGCAIAVPLFLCSLWRKFFLKFAGFDIPTNRYIDNLVGVATHNFICASMYIVKVGVAPCKLLLLMHVLCIFQA